MRSGGSPPSVSGAFPEAIATNAGSPEIPGARTTSKLCARTTDSSAVRSSAENGSGLTRMVPTLLPVVFCRTSTTWARTSRMPRSRRAARASEVSRYISAGRSVK